MVILSPRPNLSSESLTLFHATDKSLSNTPILVFHGPASSAASGAKSFSRSQVHIFSAGGFQSYPRLAISPSSPLYAAVNCLSRDEQGDEISRALAYALFKYFQELPEIVKEEWMRRSLSADRPSAALRLFSESHAAHLASQMVQTSNHEEIAQELTSAVSPPNLSYLDADIVLPTSTISQAAESNGSGAEEYSSLDECNSRYGQYGPLIRCFGETSFIPTSRIQRAPSRANTLSRRASFSASKKETLRRELNELVDTEESYVTKLDELVHDIAADFRSSVEANDTLNQSSKRHAVDGLFPTSLDEILNTNASFFDSLRSVLEETEAGAIEDIETTLKNDTRSASQPRSTDPTGAMSMANCILEWAPKFSELYREYMRSHRDCGRHLKILMVDATSALAQKVHSIGEQRLMSTLIEPVQRLPRYGLYIDNIVKQLPVNHAALKPFLKVRDILSDICAQDAHPDQHSKVLNRLRKLVPSWPASVQPQGRFITAVDLAELSPPYHKPFVAQDSSSFVAVLFADYLVLLQKVPDSTVSARAVAAEVEKIDDQEADNSSSQVTGNELMLRGHAALNDLELVELEDGALIKTIPTTARPQPDHSLKAHQQNYLLSAIRVFFLGGSYESRASRFVKDIVKARVESRFTEQERESPKWEARALEEEAYGLGLFTAVFENNLRTEQPSRWCSGTLVVVDPKKSPGFPNLSVGDKVHSLICVSSEGEGFFKLETESSENHKTYDLVTTSEFIPVLMKRLSNMAQARIVIRNPVLTSYFLQHNQSILASLSLPQERRPRSHSRTPNLRQRSPVKTLSKLFGGTSFRDATHEQKSTSPSRVPAEPPTPRPALGPKAFSQDKIEKGDARTYSKVALISNDAGHNSSNSPEALEKILENYALSLHARKGNVIGRNISGRNHADETAVNELYNALLEQHSDHERTAQAPIDVLFAAFEKFLKHAWHEQLGPVLEQPVLQSLQTESERLSPIDFEEHLVKTISDMAPQNQRAFRAILGLLVDLLDGTSNDGDRGALMAAMTEITVQEGDAHHFMPLFDRLVEEHEIVLRRSTHSGATTPVMGSLASTTGRSTNAGSLSSKASSLSKRLGFGSLHRENSKADSMSRVGSVLRTFSKSSHSKGDSQTKLPLNRTQSVDSPQHGSPNRPGSKDNPSTPGSEGSRPGSGRSWDQLETLQESVVGEHSASPVKKKRRSSLSDLPPLPLPNTSPFWAPPTHKRPENSPLARQAVVDRSAMPSPLVPRSPLRANAIRQRANTNKPEHAPSTSADASEMSVADSRPQSADSHKRAESVSSPPQTPQPHAARVPNATTTHGRAGHVSSPASAIPVPKGVLTERPGSSNTPPPALSSDDTNNNNNIKAKGQNERVQPTSTHHPPHPTSTNHQPPASATISRSTSPRKQHSSSSPQKQMRERVQAQQGAIASAESSLQVELSKIGEELRALGTVSSSSSSSAAGRRNGSPQRTANGNTAVGKRSDDAQQAAIVQNLNMRLKALEARVKHLTGNLTGRTAELEKDVLGALRLAERRAREFEVRLKEAGAENDLLYARGNEELMRVFDKVSGSGGGGGGGGGGDGAGGIHHGNGAAGNQSGDGSVEAEMKRKLEGSLEELRKEKRETARLRRENAGLKAKVEGVDGK
ncbi:MAG: hypothetical protein M1831_001648 [Alyxoria varia]|nr:MAG: hypothetical protein M1831_001648 [Alyxoria varia]